MPMLLLKKKKPHRPETYDCQQLGHNSFICIINIQHTNTAILWQISPSLNYLRAQWAKWNHLSLSLQFRSLPQSVTLSHSLLHVPVCLFFIVCLCVCICLYVFEFWLVCYEKKDTPSSLKTVAWILNKLSRMSAWWTHTCRHTAPSVLIMATY